MMRWILVYVVLLAWTLLGIISLASSEPDSTTVKALSMGYNETDISLAKGIVQWRVKHGGAVWYECGKRYADGDIKWAALEWASEINKAAIETTYLYKGQVTVVNRSEAIGVMIKESDMDRCALGMLPRKRAIQKGLLTSNRQSISYSKEQLEKVFTSPELKGTKADLGPGQILKTIAVNVTWPEVRDKYMTLNPGIKVVFHELAKKGEFYKTRTPSLYWPGSKGFPRYYAHVSYLASLFN